MVLFDGKIHIMQEGDVYVAKVVKIVDYGAYVALPSGPQALLHISELSHSKVGFQRIQNCCAVHVSIHVNMLAQGAFKAPSV